MTTNQNRILSKTSFLKGLQCPKALFFHAQRAGYKRSSAYALKKEEKKGFTFERSFSRIHLKDADNLLTRFDGKLTENVTYVQNLIVENKAFCLREAAFEFDGAFTLCDAVINDNSDIIKAYEIKNSNKVKGIYFHDLAYQYWILSNIFKGKEVKLYLVLRDSKREFKILDLYKQIIKLQPEIRQKINEFKQLVSENEQPQVATGKHCTIPYACKYLKDCGVKC